MFKKWELFYKITNVYILLWVLFLLFWVIEVAFFSDPFHGTLVFTVFYNFIGTLMSIAMIDKLTKAVGKPLYDDPRVFICTGLLLYFLGELLPVLLSSHFFEMSRFFKRRMLNLADAFVTLMYLIFTYSLVLMAKKHRTTTYKSYLSPMK